MTSVKVSCPIYPSEDPEKVKNAINRIFPGIELSEADGKLIGGGSLDTFSKLIRKQAILDSTRAMLFKGIRGDTTLIRLNKQVATVGIISFAEPRTVLGNIDVFIQDDDLESLINRVAPETVDGKEVFT
jgi:predicted RNA binding protein with dsRBD fold (UPF0201 family)